MAMTFDELIKVKHDLKLILKPSKNLEYLIQEKSNEVDRSKMVVDESSGFEQTLCLLMMPAISMTNNLRPQK